MFYPKSPCCPDNGCSDETNLPKAIESRCADSEAELLEKIRQLSFTAYDLQLFLDTHPGDEQALELFTKVCATLAGAKTDYEMKFRPLRAFSTKNEIPFAWVSDSYSWPWAKEGEK